MPTPQELALSILKAERDRLSTLIAMMEGTPGKRGKQDMPIALSVPRRRGVRKWTAAQKKAQAERAAKMWAARKAAKGGKKKAAKKSVAA